MHKSKFLGVAIIISAVIASTVLAREPRDKIGWQDFDTNGDDVISFLEFQERNRFELGTIDASKDGMLSLDEFLQTTQEKAGQKKPPKEFLEEKKSLATKRFEEMDTDFDGLINIDELQDAKFDAMDKNGDGVLSWKELRKKGEYSTRRWRQQKGNHQL